MNRTAHRLVLIIIAAVVGTLFLANPASANTSSRPASVKFSWSTDAAGVSARTSTTIATGESVAVTAKFGLLCRGRSVRFDMRLGTNPWVTVQTNKTTDAQPSVAFSSAAYMPGTVSFRVHVSKKGTCAAGRTMQSFTVNDVPTA